MATTMPNSTVLNNTPIVEPPPGVKSNISDPRNPLGSISIAAAAICMSLVFLTAGIRIYTKLRVLRTFHVEDYIIIPGSLSTIAFCVMFIVSTHNGAGVHIWDLSIARFMRLMFIFHITAALYIPAIFFARFSVLWPMIRLFVPWKSGPIFYCIHATIWSNFAFYFVSVFALLFECTPREKIWNFYLKGSCDINVQALLVAGGVFNILSDIVILVLPLYSIWHLKMAVKRKVGVSFVFATALFALTCSIARLVYSFPVLELEDYSFTIQQSGLWTLGEVTAMTLCGCMPTIPTFYKHLTGKDPQKSPILDEQSPPPMGVVLDEKSEGSTTYWDTNQDISTLNLNNTLRNISDNRSYLGFQPENVESEVSRVAHTRREGELRDARPETEMAITV